MLNVDDDRTNSVGDHEVAKGMPEFVMDDSND